MRNRSMRRFRYRSYKHNRGLQMTVTVEVVVGSLYMKRLPPNLIVTYETQRYTDLQEVNNGAKGSQNFRYLLPNR